ncbi:MAG: S8 family serine peptidase [Caldilineaceae bacterium]
MFYQKIRKTVHFVSLWLVLVALLPPSLSAQDNPPTVHAAAISDYLQAQLASAQGPVSFLVILQEQVDANAVLKGAALSAASQQSKAGALYAALTATALRTQAPLRAWLDAQGIPYQSFYLINMLEVRGNAATAAALRQRPEVARLVANPTVRQALSVAPVKATGWQTLIPAEAQQTSALPYGLDYTHAPDVWALGFRGQGIVVASQDTGVEWDHPALKAKYRGVITSTTSLTPTINHVYNWFDAWGTTGRPARCSTNPQVPCDDDGHGSHTVGTMVGDATNAGSTLLGMAPDAKWIGCRNMNNGVGTPASYTACFQFFLAPYPQGGDPAKDGHPELGPNIINNSWGCPPSEGCDAASLRQIVETVRAAGQMVVASAGNNGASGCATVIDPIAIYDAVFSIGAHDSSGSIANFSSRGPVTIDGSKRLKPDLSAPGVAVRSAWLNGGYNTISGTSMASPHVAGATALLWSAVPALIGKIDATEQILIKSATPVPANQCDGATPVVPNNTYGYGRLNALAAVQMAQHPAILHGHVLDIDGTPLANLSIVVTDTLTNFPYTVQTGADGGFQLSLYAGHYNGTVQSTTTQFETLNVQLQASGNTQVDLHERSPTALDVVGEPPSQIHIFLPLLVQQR